MKKFDPTSKKFMVPALIAVPVIIGAGSLAVHLTAKPEIPVYMVEAIVPDEGKFRAPQDPALIENAPKPLPPVPAGTGIKGEENPKLKGDEAFYSPLNLPFVDDVSVNVGSGFIVTSDDFKKTSKLSAIMYPRKATPNASNKISLKVSEKKDTRNADWNVAVPTNITAGLYKLEITDGKKIYKTDITVLAIGDQHRMS